MEGKGEKAGFVSRTEKKEDERVFYRTEKGFALPPGIIPFADFAKMQTASMWYADYAFRARLRNLPSSTCERFVVSDDPGDCLAFEEVRARFREDTHHLVRNLRAILQETNVLAVINRSSEKRLLAWEKKLPRFTIECCPMFFSSIQRDEAVGRMIPSHHVAECLMHFDMEKRLQYVRWHSNVDTDVLDMAQTIGFGVDGDRDALVAAYCANDFSRMAKIIAGHISLALERCRPVPVEPQGLHSERE